MLGHRARGQHEFVFVGSLRDLIPDDHVLVRVDRVLDLGWLRAEVADCYAAGVGRPGIEPEAAVRRMLAGLLLGVVHDRRLMREAAVNSAIRWFAGYGLTEALPDHSSLTRIRQLGRGALPADRHAHRRGPRRGRHRQGRGGAHRPLAGAHRRRLEGDRAQARR
jgi:transposase